METIRMSRHHGDLVAEITLSRPEAMNAIELAGQIAANSPAASKAGQGCRWAATLTAVSLKA
jgi:hypothetical protein